MSTSQYTEQKPTYLTYIVVFGIKMDTKVLQQPRPVLKPTTSNHCCYQNAYSCSNERRRVTDTSKTFLLYELRHFTWKFLIMSTNVVLQYEATQRPRWFI